MLLSLVSFLVIFSAVTSYPRSHPFLTSSDWNVLTKSSEDLLSVECPDHRTCHDDQTCCKLSSGSYGCCSSPHAVCCSDGKHCCPSGYRCDESEGKCEPRTTTQAADIQPVYVGMACPDGSSCGNDQTCCKLASGSYGCCPIPNAVCCSDGYHCCPNDYACSTDGTCTDMKTKASIPMLKKEPSIPPTGPPSRTEGKLSGECTCNPTQTCCMMADGRFGCCNLADAVCCSDRLHCCPPNFECTNSGHNCTSIDSSRPVVSAGSVLSGSSGTTTPPPPPSPPRLPGAVQTENICPDETSECPNDCTCCKNPNGHGYMCCPLSNAVCCVNDTHCCPHGYTCNAVEGTCHSPPGYTDVPTSVMKKRRV